jgi:hypothetical protein
MANSSRITKTTLHVSVLALGAVLLPVLLLPAAAAQTKVLLQAAINGRDARGASSERPAVLEPDSTTKLGINVTNETNRDIAIKIVRVKGIVMGITFYSHDTIVGLTVPTGAQEVREFDLDLFGLRDQAVGLIPSTVSIIGNDRETLAEEDFVADVQGSLRSTYGIFGLAVAVGTGIALFKVLRRLATHQLPANRWQRAMRFVTVGTGLGLTLVFTVSALRIFAPATGTAILLVAGSILAFFVVGYLTPSPREEEEIEEEEQEQEAWGRAVMSASGMGMPPAEFGSRVKPPTPAGWTSGQPLARADDSKRVTGAAEEEEGRVIRLDDDSEEAPRSDDPRPVRSGDTLPGRAISGGAEAPVRSGETTSPDAPQ